MGIKHDANDFSRRARGQTHTRLPAFVKALQKTLYVAAIVACLLPQTLLAALTTNAVVGDVLIVESDGADPIVVTCVGGQVKVNDGDPTPATDCADLTGFAISGGPGANVIDLNVVNAPEFTTTLTVTVSAGAGNDIITGTFFADVLHGDEDDDRVIGHRGGDTMFGDEGDDTLVWNNGDGSDVAEGGSDNDTMEVNGSANFSETFTITPSVSGVRFDRVSPAPFSIDIISPTENLILSSFAGADIVTGAVGLAGVISITVNAGDGDDLLRGGDGADTLNGDGGNDHIIGFRGEDNMNGGEGNDTMVWNPGDGSDVANGEAGNDTVIVNGGGVSETFTVDASPTGAFFQRVTPFFSVDIISPTENLILNANGGGDIFTGTVGLRNVLSTTVNGGDGDDFITGTDANDTLNGDAGNDLIVGFTGADAMNGGADDDTMVWNPGDGNDVARGGDGNDTVIVNGGGVTETFKISGSVTGAFFERVEPNPFFVDIISPTENLILNANGGGDIVTGTVGLAGVLNTTVNGGDGNDSITGTDGDDTLNGDGGNDLIVGFRGADVMNGGEGDDTMVWNPGDGSDVANGGSGNDTMLVNGGGVSETFTVDASPTGAFFQRVTPFFSVDIISTTENLLLNGNGGGDIVTGSVGLNGILTTTVSGGDGDDHITGTDGPDTLNGDAGNDTLVGFRGSDVMNGGEGNDTMVWNNGDGSDIMNGGPGDDTAVVNGGPLSETFTISPTTLVAAVSPDAPNQGGTTFRRLTQVPFTLDIVAEGVDVNGNDGDDTLNMLPLEDVDVTFDGGSAPVADILRVNAQGAAVEFAGNQVLVDDKRPISHENVETVQIVNEAFPAKTYMPLIREWEAPTFAQ